MIEPLGLLCTKRDLRVLIELKYFSISGTPIWPCACAGQRGGKQQGDGRQDGGEKDAHAPDMTGEWGGFKCSCPLPKQVNERLPWRQQQRGTAHACGNGRRLQNTGRALSDHQIYLNELALADMAEPAGLRIDLGRRAPLHRLHDVPRRRAVPLLHGGPHQARAAGLDGGGAAVARPDAGGRAGLDARPSLGRPHDPGSRSRRGQGPSSTASGSTWATAASCSSNTARRS